MDLILAQERPDRLVNFLIDFLVELGPLLEPLVALKALQRFAAGRELLASLLGHFLRLFDLRGVELQLLLDARVGKQPADVAAAKKAAAASTAAALLCQGRPRHQGYQSQCDDRLAQRPHRVKPHCRQEVDSAPRGVSATMSQADGPGGQRTDDLRDACYAGLATAARCSTFFL